MYEGIKEAKATVDCSHSSASSLEALCAREPKSVRTASGSASSPDLREAGSVPVVRHRTRLDQPCVVYQSRGSKSDALMAAASDADLNTAVARLQQDMFSASTLASRDSRLATWNEFHVRVMGATPLCSYHM